MGLLGSAQQFASTVLITVKSNTDDAKRGLKSLSAEERKIEAERVARAEKENARMDKHIKRLAMVGAGVAGVAVAIAVASKGLDAYAKTNATAAREVERMKETASKAMDTISAAIGKAAMALEPLVNGFSNVVDLLSRMEMIAPIAIAAISMAITANPKVAALLALAGWAATTKSGVAGLIEEGTERTTLRGFQGRGGNVAGMLAGQQALEATKKLDAAIAKAQQVEQQFEVMDMKRKASTFTRGSNSTSEYTDPLVAQLEADIEAERAANQAASTSSLLRGGIRTGGVSNDGVEASLANFYSAGGEFTRRLQVNADNDRFTKKDSFLEKTLGPIEQFDAYANAFGLLTGAVTTAMDAWISGTMGAGDALKIFLASQLKALAVEGAVNALKYAALAISYGSTPGMQFWVPGAVKAAAAWGGVAVAAGAGAVALGSSAGGGASAAPGYSPTGNQYQSGGVTNVIHYGDSFADDSPRNKKIKARKMVSSVLGTSGVEYR